MGDLGDGLHVFQGEAAVAARAAAHAAHGGGAGDDHDQVGSQACYAGFDSLLRAFAHRQHGDDGPDADQDAQHGKGAADLVGAQCAQGRGAELLEFSKAHLGVREVEFKCRAALGRRRCKSHAAAPGGVLLSVSCEFVGHDHAVLDPDDALGMRRDFGFVRDHDDGDAAAVQELELVQNVLGLVRG